MEERIELLEAKVEILHDIITSQQEMIEGCMKCLDRLIEQRENSIEIDRNLFIYCKKLRKEIEVIKDEA